jgi:hypothetical protein
MQPFEYVSLLTSIVLALGITRILTGVGKVVQLRRTVRLSAVHVLWAFNVLIWLLLNWWILYRWRTYEGWTFFLFLFVLVSPIVAFLLSVLLFPEPLEEGAHLKDHYYANRRAFFLLAALLPPIDAIDTLLKGRAHFEAQGPLYVFTLVAIFGLSLIGAWTKRERYHAAFAVFFLLYMLVFISVNLRLLS